MLAAFNGKRDCLEALLQAGADKARAGCRCLHVGSKGGELVVEGCQLQLPETFPHSLLPECRKPTLTAA